MTNYYEKVKQFVEKNPHLVLPVYGIPATTEIVMRVEKELGLKLCGEYLQFIQTWGSLLLVGFSYDYDAVYLWDSKEIYWVIDEAKHLWNNRGLPRNYIPIVSMDGEDWFCLDPTVDGDQAVYFFDGAANKLYRKESDSLFELIWREIEERVIPNAMKEGRQVN